MKINKMLGALGVAALMTGVVQASVVRFDDLGYTGGGAVSIDGTTTGKTITISTNGNDLVYSFAFANRDLDGGGVSNDSLSWDVVVSGFASTSADDTGVTLGDQATAVIASNSWTVDDLLWNKTETLKFSIANVSLDTDITTTWEFNGFDGLWLTAGSYYMDIGTTDQLTMTGNAAVSFDAITELFITGGATERIRGLDGSFTVSVVPEPATVGVFGLGGLMIFCIRRRMKR